MLSESYSTVTLKEFLNTFQELKQTGEFEFRNNEQFPFTQLYLLKTDNLYSYSDKDVDAEKTNLITIICSKGNDNDSERAKETFIAIASFLKWKLVDEETNEGI